MEARTPETLGELLSLSCLKNRCQLRASSTRILPLTSEDEQMSSNSRPNVFPCQPSANFRSLRSLYRLGVWAIASLSALIAVQTHVASAAFVQIEVQDWDAEGSPHDLTGNQLFPDNALFNPPTGLGTLKPSGTKGGGLNYMGQTTEWANFVGENSPSIKSYVRSFSIPKTYNNFPVTKATLLYDFVFLTDDLGDFGVGQSDIGDDDYFRVHLDGLDILKVDSDQVIVPGTVVGLTPPQTNSDPLESTGFEKRTGTVGNPWLMSSHDVTTKIGKKVNLGFEVVDPVLLNPVGESLESGMMIDEIRLLLFYDNTPSTASADFDQSGVVDELDLAILKENFGGEYFNDADLDEDFDGNDFLIWQSQMGSVPELSANISGVPEPSTFLLAFACTAIGLCLPREWRCLPDEKNKK